MLRKIIETDGNDTASLIARVFLGVVILPHGLQKLLGMFGGYGFSATVDYFSSVGIPSLIGFISRISAAGIALIMLGAVFMVHHQYGFFMNWFGAQEGEGFEYHLLALGLAVVVLVSGGGRWSADGVIARM